MPQTRSISVILRTTEGCNLSCKYCYVRPSTVNEVLSLALFEKLIEELVELNYCHITLYWHGGEPLLAGLDYFRNAVEIERKLSERHDIVIANKMQTNGTLITEEWVDFFEVNGFRVGISLDGDEDHNENRVFASGKNSFPAALRGLELMEAGRFRTSILSVLTRNHVHHLDRYYAFVKQLGVRSFKVNPCLINKQESSELQVQPIEWGEAMIHLFDLWFNDDNPPHNREFHNIIGSFFVGRSTLCTYNKTCFLDFISTVPSGDVFPCARLINEDSIFALGNIASGMPSVFERYGHLKRDYDHLGCEECRWQQICYGGCTALAYWANHDINTHDFLCEGYKILFQHIYDTVQERITSDHPLWSKSVR